MEFKKTISLLAFLLVLLQTNLVFARINSITLGIGSSVDLYERDSDNDDDESQKIALSPLFHFQSEGQKDSFQFRFQPSLIHDFEDSESDWDATVFLEGNKEITRSWSLGISNVFIRSDYYNESAGVSLNQVDTPTADLSPDDGRRRFDKNTVKINSRHLYGDEKEVLLEFENSILRNEESDVENYDDFDKYSFNIDHSHRFNISYSAGYNLGYVYADFEPTNREIAELDDDTSEDVEEFRGGLFLGTYPDKNNDYILDYSLAAFRYDGDSQDVDVHNIQLQWKKRYNKRLNTTLGAGVSYIDEENEDETWGGNGLAELDYLLERGFIRFSAEKKYDVDNFSGSDEQELLDTWDLSIAGGQRLTEALSASGSLFYRYEDRDFNSNNDDDFTSELFGADLGFEYPFARYYSFSLQCSYLQKESDRNEEEYEDYRVLFSINWRKKVAQW